MPALWYSKAGFRIHKPRGRKDVLCLLWGPAALLLPEWAVGQGAHGQGDHAVAFVVIQVAASDLSEEWSGPSQRTLALTTSSTPLLAVALAAAISAVILRRPLAPSRESLGHALPYGSTIHYVIVPPVITPSRSRTLNGRQAPRFTQETRTREAETPRDSAKGRRR